MRTRLRVAIPLIGFALITSSLWATDAHAASQKTKKVKEVAATEFTQVAVIEGVNKERIKQGLPALATDAKLSEAAQKKADDMVNRGYFAHNTPSGAQFFEVLDDVGYNYQHAGENLAAQYQTISGTVKAWMDSPGHRANILNGSYEETGVGLAYGERKGKKGWYVVQLFGTEF